MVIIIGRVIIRVTPFRALITLLVTYLLRPLPLHLKTRRTPQYCIDGCFSRGPIDLASCIQTQPLQNSCT